MVWPFHSFTPHVMGWVGNNEIKHGLKTATRGALYMLMSGLVAVKIQCKAVTSALLSANIPDNHHHCHHHRCHHHHHCHRCCRRRRRHHQIVVFCEGRKQENMKESPRRKLSPIHYRFCFCYFSAEHVGSGHYCYREVNGKTS